jgi:hypothetical protein
MSNEQILIACDFYTNKLAEKFGSQLITPALLYLLEDELKKIQKHMVKFETNACWRVPVKVIVDYARHTFRVQPVGNV